MNGRSCRIGRASRLGAETTFPRDLTDEADIQAALVSLIDDVWSWRERSGMSGRTATVKIKYADFELITRSRTLPRPVANRAELAEIGRGLLASTFPLRKPIRLLGVSMSSFDVGEPETELQGAFEF
jgi:DNA polymerase-4